MESGLAPEQFIAVFYTGLGAALLLAGLLFGRNFGKAAFAANQMCIRDRHDRLIQVAGKTLVGERCEIPHGGCIRFCIDID